jgi:DNA-binding GntR family transcriptional regulator
VSRMIAVVDGRKLRLERSLTEEAYEALENRIVTGQLQPGSMASEQVLAKALGLGRMPIREALQRLAREGLVVVHPRRGIQIPDASVELELKLLEVRRPLQSQMVRLAARRSSDEQRERMRELAVELRERVDIYHTDEGVQMVREVHHLLADSSGNDYLVRVLRPILGLTRRFWFLHRSVGDSREGAALHSKLLTAIADGDEAAAAQASEALMEFLERFARATLDA